MSVSQSVSPSVSTHLETILFVTSISYKLFSTILRLRSHSPGYLTLLDYLFCDVMWFDLNHLHSTACTFYSILYPSSCFSFSCPLLYCCGTSFLSLYQFHLLSYLLFSQAWDNSTEYYRCMLSVYHSYLERKNKTSLPALITGQFVAFVSRISTVLLCLSLLTLLVLLCFAFDRILLYREISADHYIMLIYFLANTISAPLSVCNYFDRTFKEYERRIISSRRGADAMDAMMGSRLKTAQVMSCYVRWCHGMGCFV